MNKLLQRQLREHFGGADKVPESFNKLLDVISGSYDHYEKDRKMIERSIELSSKEMIDLNSDLKKEKEESKKAQNELQQAPEGITKIMDSSLDVICAVDEDGYFIEVSAACETIWGYKADELIGRPLIDFVYPEDREKTQMAAINVRAGNNMINFENRYIRKDGSLVPINWSARWDAKDRMRYAIARDATEKKKLEKAFEIERQRFHDLFIKAPSCVGILKGPDHVYEMANPLYLQLINKDDIIGKPIKEVLPEIAEQGFIELLDGVYKTGVTFSANEMLVKLDKESNGKLADIYLNFIYQAYKNNEGTIEGIFFFAIDVTEQVLSRKKIEESEFRYRSLIEQATDAICIADSSMKFIDVNSYACESLGYSKEEALQLSVIDVLFTEDLALNPFKYDEVQPNEIIRNERRFKRKDGTSVIMEVSTRLTEDGRFIMFGHDVSERKRAESVLKESEDQLTIATQIAKLGYWEFDVTKNLFKFNDQFYSIFKTTAEEVGGYTMSSEQYTGLFVHPDDIPMITKEASDSIKSPDPHYSRQIEYRIKYADGGIGYVLARFLILKNELGRTIKTFGAIQDITESKNAETALKENEGQLTVVAQIAKLGYWEFDVIKGLFKFNDQFYSIFKTTAEKMGGYTMSHERYAGLFVHADDIPIVGKEVADAINSPDPDYSRQIEHRIIYANGETGHMAVRFFIVKDDHGRTIKTFGANQDITDRKKVEETLLRSEAILEIKNVQLEQKNRELEQFAYVASHDMQEPLRTTSSFVELLQKQYKGKLDEKADKYLTFISQSSDRMKVLIKDLLDYSRIGRKKELAEVDCNIMLNEVLADLGKAINEANAEIKAGDLPVINGYPTEIKQLFQNLIINAIKFRKQNTIPDITICVQKKDSYWEFAVKDNGIGIDQQHKERIFIIFQRLHTRNEYDGSGIGLAHCKKIVELHGGKIWIESEPGEGSTFYFTILQNNK